MNILKPITCVNGLVYGKVSNFAQYLNGSPDCKQYEVVCLLDGTPLELIVKHGFAKAIIESRKHHTTKDMVLKLKNDTPFVSLVSASPKDANQLAAALNVDSMSDEALDALQAKIEARMAAKAAEAAKATK